MNHALDRAGHAPHTEAALSGYDGVPWPEFLRGRPALVVPQVPGLPRPLDPAVGWTRSLEEAIGQVQPDWMLVLTGRRLTVTGPGRMPWFEGHPLLTRDWMRAAGAQQQVLLISGPFARIDQFRAAAMGDDLRVLLVPTR